MTAGPVLETERLILRPWRDDDLEPFAAMNADPEVMRFLSGGIPMAREDSDAMVARNRAHFEKHGFGLWAVMRKDNAHFAGFIGLATPAFLPEVLPTFEIGWRLGRAHWGQGLATEGARRSLDYGFEEAGLDEVCSIHDPGNVASRRVMEKLGMRFDRDTTHPMSGQRLRVFWITRAEWEAQRR